MFARKISFVQELLSLKRLLWLKS